MVDRQPEHGTLNEYKNHGCRCDDCRGARREAGRQDQRLPPDPERHGTRTNYIRGCRCDDCTTARAASYQRTRRKPVDPDRHGTSTNYERGCRCAACYEWKAARNATTSPGPRRGPVGRYRRKGDADNS